MSKLILLDRDGVINFDSPDYIKSPEEWQPIPGSLEAIALLTRAGFTVAVTTNQSGVGRGYYDLKTLAAIHEKMLTQVREEGGEISAIFFCPHHPDEQCLCRKPKPGLLFQARDYFQADLSEVWSVGDSKRDIEAAVAAGCKPVLVRTGNGDKVLKDNQLNLPDSILIFDDLLAAARAALSF